MYRVIIETEAGYELTEASLWYEERSAGLGAKFIDAFLNVIEYLEKHPAAFVKIAGDYHQITMKRFPFVVVYKIIAQEVRVISVFHTSRDPQKKLK